MQIENYLLSFAVDAKDVKDFSGNIIIDSGAFTVWNKGGTIDIEKYLAFCLTLPQNYTFINLDVIPKTGSGSAEIEIACDKSFENYQYLSSKLPNVLPVYHYGDNLKWLKAYADATDYVGVSPANDTHESVKREFLRTVYKHIDPIQTRTHGLGYSSFDGLTYFPFYSVDSISFKKVQVWIDQKKKTFWANDAMEFLQRRRIQQFLNMEKHITELWKQRGIEWNI